MREVELGQILLADVQAGQKRQRRDTPSRMMDEQSEHDPHVTVDVRTAGWSRRGVVVDAGPLHMWPVTRRGRVVEGQHQAAVIGHQRLDHLVGQSGGDEVGAFPSRGSGLMAN